jgi:hypothetical protein
MATRPAYVWTGSDFDEIGDKRLGPSVTALNSALAEKVPFAYGTATPTTTVEGFVWYDENDTPPTPKFWDGAAFQALTSGKILQIVRATDSTTRTTTSTSFVDVTGMSVTITPQKPDSAVLIIVTGVMFTTWMTDGNNLGGLQITDASNNAISGAEGATFLGTANITGSGSRELRLPFTLIGYSTPATTNATTYKFRFRIGSSGTTLSIRNDGSTGQIFAIEVSA